MFGWKWCLFIYPFQLSILLFLGFCQLPPPLTAPLTNCIIFKNAREGWTARKELRRWKLELNLASWQFYLFYKFILTLSWRKPTLTLFIGFDSFAWFSFDEDCLWVLLVWLLCPVQPTRLAADLLLVDVLIWVIEVPTDHQTDCFGHGQDEPGKGRFYFFYRGQFPLFESNISIGLTFEEIVNLLVDRFSHLLDHGFEF